MTNFEKVQSYYNMFDEWDRFDTAEGRLEFELTLPIITNRFIILPMEPNAFHV